MDSGNGTILSSQWGGLSDFLIAKFYEVDEKGIRAGNDSGLGVEVHAPISDGHRDMTLNWQSPFEAASPDTKAPALAAMLQSGALATVMSDLTSAATGSKPTGAQNNQSPSALENSLNDLKGRTGITKLNSTQIFTGMAPIRFTFNVHFRALADPYNEVEAPVNQLIYWAAPKKLSTDSIVKRATSADGTVGGYLKALLPSMAPTMIAFQYKTYTFAPLVIESIGDPITAPIANNGYHTEKVIPITLASLTALDRDDFKAIFSPGASN
ncbi:hypothetical protein [Paraburkholderia domus]|uniref:hypothetical protein n=1 Tax=Paraburkholderia domus TaxID=2793075 RepID=UPI0019115A62|nr:hypothetical protein [Paraburkholderia domus]MBK5061815.1 hypothetical protein [Burkholderia sp. R-70199]CAE6901051.1 hypothetical protein R70199_03695 [Paraburkholderia domus]